MVPFWVPTATGAPPLTEMVASVAQLGMRTYSGKDDAAPGMAVRPMETSSPKG